MANYTAADIKALREQTGAGMHDVKKALEELSSVGHQDSEPKLAGRNIMVMVSPLPANKRKPRLTAQVPAPKPAATAPKPSQPAV